MSEMPSPQRDPQMRDMGQREANFGAYRDYERENLQNGDDLAGELEGSDQQFFQRDRYDPAAPHEMSDATVSERGRLQEVSGPYIDQMLEKYGSKVAQVENTRVERKHGGGILGRIRQWASDTMIGARVNYASKVTLGALCHAGSIAAPIFAPALNYTGNRLIADGVAQAAQSEIWERPILQRLQNLRLGRHIWIREMQNIRNEITASNPGTNEYIRRPVGDRLASGPGYVGNADEIAAINEVAGRDVANEFITQDQLKRRLEIIIEQLDAAEVQIHQDEERLAQIRHVGKGIRTGIGMAISAANIYQLFHGGLSMGVQDFDKLGGSHEVLMTGGGVKFAYHAGEAMGNGLLAHGGELHSLGSVAPWGQIGASAAALAASMLGSTAYDIRETGRLDEAYESEHANLPADQATFSFRDRQGHGAASGMNTEIEDDISMHAQRNHERLNELKNQMTAGSIWHVDEAAFPAGLPVPTNVRRTDGEPLMQIVRWDGQQGLTFAFVTDEANPNVDSNGMLIEERYTLSNADSVIDRAKNEAADLKSTTPEGKIDKYLEKRSEGLETPQQREVSVDIALPSRTIPAGHFVEISRPASARGQVVVKEYQDGSSTPIGATIIVDPATNDHWKDQLNPLFDNSGLIDNRKDFVEKKIDKAIETKGEDIKANPYRRILTDVTVAGHTFHKGNFIKIERPAASPEQIIIQEYSDATTKTGRVTLDHLSAPIEFGIIIDNSDKIKNLQEGVESKEKESNQAVLKEINKILQKHLPSNKPINDKTKGQFFQLGDPADDRWLAITDVDDTVPGGKIGYIIGVDRDAIVKAKGNARKPLLDAAIYDGSNEEQTFQEFKDFLELPSGTSFANRLMEQAVKI